MGSPNVRSMSSVVCLVMILLSGLLIMKIASIKSCGDWLWLTAFVGLLVDVPVVS